MMQYSEQTILVFGLGLSGRSALSFLMKRGARVIGYDQKPQKDLRIEVFTNLEEVPFDELDLIVYSPGISKDHSLFSIAEEKSIPLVGEIELGAREIQTRAIGITGTNGKSTTTTLVAHLLNEAGIPALAIGNIGVPLTSKIEELNDKVAVIELSSYQIEDLQSKFLDVALFLNLSEDHLDRYKTMQAYGIAKFQIQEALKDEGIFLYDKDLYSDWPQEFRFKRKEVYNCTLPKNTPKNFIGEQNLQAAYRVVKQLGVSGEQFTDGIKTFKGLAHRLEYVKEIKGRAFYNDSKATNIQSVVRALESFSSPLILIMGGEDKGLDFSALLPYFRDNVKIICVIGDVREVMHTIFSPVISTIQCDSLQEAIHQAFSASEPGDTVLLSPSCSSFDQFRNFEERGREFKRIVNQLEGVRS